MEENKDRKYNNNRFRRLYKIKQEIATESYQEVTQRAKS